MAREHNMEEPRDAGNWLNVEWDHSLKVMQKACFLSWDHLRLCIGDKTIVQSAKKLSKFLTQYTDYSKRFVLNRVLTKTSKLRCTRQRSFGYDDQGALTQKGENLTWKPGKTY